MQLGTRELSCGASCCHSCLRPGSSRVTSPALATRASSALSAGHHQQRDVMFLSRQKQERACLCAQEESIVHGLASPHISLHHQTVLPHQTQEPQGPVLNKPLANLAASKETKEVFWGLISPCCVYVTQLGQKISKLHFGEALAKSSVSFVGESLSI